jgi:putative DNA primase/helicase
MLTDSSSGVKIIPQGAVPSPPVLEPHLSTALRYLERFPQFIVYLLTHSTERPGKLDKIPVHPATNSKLEWTTPSNWMTYQAALDAASSASLKFVGQYGVGFVITPETKLFCLDIDGALQKGVSCPGCFSEETRSMLQSVGLGDSLAVPNAACSACGGRGVNQWHPLAGKLRAALPQACAEISVSLEGLHQWGRYSGPEPEHAKVKIVEGIKTEIFTSGKWFALGDQSTAVGDAGADCTVELSQVIATYFPPETDAKMTWSSGHELGWELPDDDELIRRALSFNNAAAAFGDKASFSALWNGDATALGRAWPSAGRPYDASSADMALASKLAWLTGNDCPRIELLLWKSGLVREKWETHKNYLCGFTIPKALVKDGEFYDPKYAERSPATAAAPGAAYAPAATVADMAAIVAANPNKDEAVQLMMQLGTQDSIASAFAMLYAGKLKFDHSRKKWHIWDGTRWREDDKKRAFDLVVNLCREKNREGKSSMGSASFAHGVEDIASTRTTLAVSGSEWDRDNYLLNTPAGTYDLRTCQIKAHDPEDMITKCTGASAGTVSDGAAFRKFMMEITDGDNELIRFLQVSLGAVLSGAIESHWMQFWTGVGRNGKNTLGELVQDVMGDYAKKIQASTLMSKKFQSHSEEIADLHGFRLAISSELNDGEHWDEARINEVTGDGTLSARHMYGSRFQFKRTHKHVVYANYKPQLRSVSDGIRSRIKLVPFKVSFLGREDADLPARLRGDVGYVLQWLIEGHQQWLEAGKKLPACTAVDAETSEYFENQSTPQLWLKERCENRHDIPELQLPTIMELYRDYKDWATARGELPLSKKRWEGQWVKPSQKVETRRGCSVKGLRLKLPFGDFPSAPVISGKL